METKKITINLNSISIMLFIIFLMLKLDAIIQWKWVWVFSPIWIGWVIQACALIAPIIITIIKIIFESIKALKWECSMARSRVSGSPLVWDAKTNTLYGPYNEEQEE